jgi:hypothetical protein
VRHDALDRHRCQIVIRPRLQLLAEPVLRHPLAQLDEDCLPNLFRLIEQALVGRLRLFPAHQLRMGFDKEITQQSFLPARQYAGAHRRNVGSRQHEQHLERFRRADLAGEPQHHLLVRGISPECGAGHQEMVANEKHQELCLVIIHAEPLGHIHGNPLTDEAVVLFLPLTDIVNEQRKVQQVFPLDLTIDSAQEAVRGADLFGLTHREQAVLVHGVLVVGIELHEAADGPERRNEPLQQMHPMHRSERVGHPSRP